MRDYVFPMFRCAKPQNLHVLMGNPGDCWAGSTEVLSELDFCAGLQACDHPCWTAVVAAVLMLP